MYIVPLPQGNGSERAERAAIGFPIAHRTSAGEQFLSEVCRSAVVSLDERDRRQQLAGTDLGSEFAELRSQVPALFRQNARRFEIALFPGKPCQTVLCMPE